MKYYQFVVYEVVLECYPCVKFGESAILANNKVIIGAIRDSKDNPNDTVYFHQ